MPQALDPSLRFLVQALRPRRIVALGDRSLLEALKAAKSLKLADQAIHEIEVERAVDSSASAGSDDAEALAAAERARQAMLQARLLHASSPALIPEKVDLVLVGEGKRAPLEPAYCLHWAREAAAFETATGRHTRARLQVGRKADAGDGILAMGSAPPPAVRERLDAIRAASQRQSPTAPIGEDVGALLYLLTRAGRVRHALEIGSGAGASTLWLGSAFAGRGGRLVSVERDSRMATMARKSIKAGGLEQQVDLRVGDLEGTAHKLGKGYELLFLDEDYEGRLDDLELLLPLMSSGALIISHGGRDAAAPLARYHAMLQLHPRVRATLRLGLGEGLSIALLK